MKTWQGSLGISDHEGIVSPAYFVARPLTDDCSAFLHHLLRSLPLITQYGARSKGIRPSQWDLPWEQFQNITVELPTPATQRATADYLDRETARIDAVIAAKRQMGELLEERRQAQISDILWTQEARPVRLKFLAAPPTSGNRDHSSFTFTEDGVPCLRGLNIRPGTIDRAAVLRLSNDDHLRHIGTRLRAGDVVVVRSGLAGSAAAIPDDLDDCNCVDLVIIRRSPRLVPDYLVYVINSHEASQQVARRSVGALLTHFNAVDAADLVLPLRSLQAQQEVVERVKKIDIEFHRMRTLLNRQVVLLVEHRQALIAAAVTGQLDITEAA
jgi:type I restriction enzyme S subunit